MTALGSYTNTDAVRGCLGVDQDDCPDRYMVDSQVSLELSLDLDGWLPTHAALFTTGTTGTPSTAAKAIADRIKLYAQWFVALEFANRPLAVPQIVTDGKAQLDRFKVDLSKVAELAAQKVAKYKGELQGAVNGSQPVALYTNYVNVATPGADPVTEVIQ
jgi:hypothetical protein